MLILRDILASAVGIGPNFKTPHQQMRDLLRLDDSSYKATHCGILEIYNTLPFIDYGSTIEDDERTARIMRNATPGGSLFDQWYNTANPEGKKRRIVREASKAYEPDLSQRANGTITRDGSGPQIMFNYYENGTWPGSRLAVMIVENLGKGQQYGTHMRNVRYGFKGKLKDWNQQQQEYRGLELTGLYVEGQSVPLSRTTLAAANDYAARLTSMIFRDDEGKKYAPRQAMQETLTLYGKDVFQTSVWQARRENASPVFRPVR